MKPFSLNSDEELLTLNNDQLVTAIRLEAIERCIKPPLTLPDALRKSEWVGFTIPAEHIEVFQFGSGWHRSGFGYLDRAKAVAALEGMIRIEVEGYGEKKVKISAGDIEIVSEFVGVRASDSKAAKFEEYCQDEDDKKFTALREECLGRYARVRQAAYDSKVRSVKKAEYLRLAAGNEEVARAFWAKTEGSDWPSEQPWNYTSSGEQA